MPQNLSELEAAKTAEEEFFSEWEAKALQEEEEFFAEWKAKAAEREPSVFKKAKTIITERIPEEFRRGIADIPEAVKGAEEARDIQKELELRAETGVGISRFDPRFQFALQEFTEKFQKEAGRQPTPEEYKQIEIGIRKA